MVELVDSTDLGAVTSVKEWIIENEKLLTSIVKTSKSAP